MIILSYLVSLLGIGFLIFIHELGHFLFCKFFSIPASKFAIGIGPKLFSKKYKGTEYSLGIVPIAGYVQIGEEKDKEDKDSDIEVLYQNSWLKGTMVLFGGIIFNLMFAYIVIIGSLLFYNSRIIDTSLKLFIPQKSVIIQDKENNKIMLNYHSSVELLQSIKKDKFILEDYEGENIIFENEKFFNDNFVIKYDDIIIPSEFLSTIHFAILITNNIISQSMNGILGIFKGINLNNLAGPLGIMKGASNAIEKGCIDFLLFLALVSISLAVLNLIPIPMLDGGQFLFFSVYKLFGRGVPEVFQTILTYASLGLIIIMTLLSTYNDVLRVFFT